MTDPSFVDRLWKDADGKQALVQAPNPPLITWIVSRALSEWVFDTGRPERGLSAIAFGSLFVWAWMELVDGDCYFRRVLGVVVMGGLVYGKAR